jgi:hypothetical protein
MRTVRPIWTVFALGLIFQAACVPRTTLGDVLLQVGLCCLFMAAHYAGRP